MVRKDFGYGKSTADVDARDTRAAQELDSAHEEDVESSREQEKKTASHAPTHQHVPNVFGNCSACGECLHPAIQEDGTCRNCGARVREPLPVVDRDLNRVL